MLRRLLSRIWKAIKMAVNEEVAGWSKTAASNATADASINWSEGQTPGSVNNSARGMMAAIAKWRDDQAGQLTTAGGTTAYTLTTNQGIDALADGIRVHAVINATNTGASTLNVDSLGAKAIVQFTDAGEVALAASDLIANEHAVFQYDASAASAAGAWVLLNPHQRLTPRVTTIASGSLPSATVLDITSIPATYRELQLVVLGGSSDTATRKIQLQISVDNGSNFLATGYAGWVDDGTTNVSMATVFASVATGPVAATTQDIVFAITNYQGGLYPQVQFSGINSSGLAFAGNGSYKGGTTAVNALRLLWDGSGNFDAGTYALYGIR